MKFCIIILFLIYCFKFDAKIISTFKPRLIQTDNDPATVEYIFTINNKHHHIILSESEYNKHEIIVAVDGKPYKRLIHPKGTFMVGRFANNLTKKIFLYFNKGIHGLFVYDNTTLEIMPIEKFQNRPELRYHAKNIQKYHHDHVAVFYDKKEYDHFECKVSMKNLNNNNDKKRKCYDPHYSILPDKRNVKSILRLGLVIPVELYQDQNFGNNNTQMAIDRALVIVYSSNQLFEATNILVITHYIEIFTDNSVIPPLNDSRLDLTLDIVDKILRPRIDAALKYTVSIVLFTKYGDYSNKGSSWTDSICGNLSNSVILVENLERTVFTMIHEIGHTFGLTHTKELNDPTCHCEKICIMNVGDLNGPIDNYSWNTCDYRKFLKALYLSCLIPMQISKLKNTNNCGNNKIDPGEECDCGLPSDCALRKLDKFCDPFSCKYYPECDCLEGVCCKNCKTQSKNSKCTDINNECLGGICTGAVDICISLQNLPNGTKCNNQKDMCYNGKCIEYGSICNLAFGDTAEIGNQECHSYFNSRNDATGNCGYDKKLRKFIPCDTGDYICGKLVCKAEVKNYIENIYPYEINKEGCAVNYMPIGEKNFKNIIMVQDGITCSANKTCMFNKCLSSDEIDQYKMKVLCGEFSHLSKNGECACNDGYDIIEGLCFLKLPSSKIYPIIISLFAIIQFYLLAITIFRFSQKSKSKIYQMVLSKLDKKLESY